MCKLMQIAYERLDLLQNDKSKIVIITKYLLLIDQNSLLL